MTLMKQIQKPKQKKPSVAVIIVTYNGASFIKRCLTSLLQQSYPKEQFSVIVVDNASTDNTLEIIEVYTKEKNKGKQNLTIVKNTQNSGFGIANNIGIKSVSAVDYIALLNQDAWVERDWLESLVDAMEKHPEAGCCGAAEHPYDETLQIPEEKKASTKAGCWMGGGSLLIRKKALDVAGFFDDIYFMYGEDMDLTWRLQLAGYTIIMNNRAIWHHHGRKRNDQTMDWRVYYSWRNRIFLLIKFGSMQQLSSSLWNYFQYFILGKRKNTMDHVCDVKGKEEKKEQNKIKPLSLSTKCTHIAKKIFFSIKLCCACFYYFPHLLQRRMEMKKQSIDYRKTDQWIRETDMQLYGI